MSFTHLSFKTGRIKPLPHQRMKRATIAPSKLPPAPREWIATSVDIANSLFANDRYGCCVKANMANILVQIYAVMLSRKISFTEAQVIADYLAATGGQDTGLVETDSLADAVTNGFLGIPIACVLAIDPQNLDAMRSLCAVFGGLYLGMSLPARAETQLQAGLPWTVGNPPDDSDTPGSWGGHCDFVQGYRADGSFLIGTWAQTVVVTPEVMRRDVDEAYVIVPRDVLVAASPERVEFLAGILGAAVSEGDAVT